MSARDTDILACIEKMVASPIPPMYSGHLFHFVCASLPIQGFIFRSESEPGRAKVFQITLGWAGSSRAERNRVEPNGADPCPGPIQVRSMSGASLESWSKWSSTVLYSEEQKS